MHSTVPTLKKTIHLPSNFLIYTSAFILINKRIVNVINTAARSSVTTKRDIQTHFYIAPARQLDYLRGLTVLLGGGECEKRPEASGSDKFTPPVSRTQSRSGRVRKRGKKGARRKKARDEKEDRWRSAAEGYFTMWEEFHELSP
ncbi:hypothetical protein KM043_008377 [Ampulex compressa]|nr:hypothetical protein KM043_008377 [Ampulex compressa]